MVDHVRAEKGFCRGKGVDLIAKQFDESGEGRTKGFVIVDDAYASGITYAPAVAG
jgi:hypothetical protein